MYDAPVTLSRYTCLRAFAFCCFLCNEETENAALENGGPNKIARLEKRPDFTRHFPVLNFPSSLVSFCLKTSCMRRYLGSRAV